MKKIYLKSLYFLSVLVCVATTTKGQTLPRPDHIIVLIEENQPNGLIMNNQSVCPYIYALQQDTDAVTMDNFYAIEHPSEPNYLDLFSGSNQGVLDDGLPANYPFISPNMAAELLRHHLSFITYSQDLPSVGSDVINSSVGSYARKHNPVANWIGTGPNQVPDTCNQPYAGYFPTDYSQLPTVCYVVPNQDSDMHNGTYPSTATAGDFWMHEHLDSLLRWIKTHNSLFIYTFDEDDGFSNNNIPTLFYGPMVKGGTNHTHYSLYSILSTVERMYNLGEYAGRANYDSAVTDIWRTTYNTGINQLTEEPKLVVYPNPASEALNFDATGFNFSSATLLITDLEGRTVNEYAVPSARRLQFSTHAFSAGLYLYHLVQDNGQTVSGKFVVAHQ